MNEDWKPVWAGIIAALIHKLGVSEVVITVEDREAMAGHSVSCRQEGVGAPMVLTVTKVTPPRGH